jgi:lysophospholipase L1-like esterase
MKLLLDHYKFDVIHFNIGLHGLGRPNKEYGANFGALLELIKEKSPNAKLIWATSTPVREATNLQKFHANTTIVKQRNKIVVALAAKESIPVDDLFPVVVDHPEYWVNDGVHYNDQGRATLAKHVAKSVLDVLAK